MKSYSDIVFVTDCEGPITKNDNAAEMAEAFIPHGDRFFAKISLYDDYLAEVARKPGYKAGDTLRLILPFFKAYDVDYADMIDFSRRHIDIIPKADAVLKNIRSRVPAYIVSTSYSPYVRAVCEAVGFPFENAFSTWISPDEYTLSNNEKAALKEIHAEVMDLPDFSIPSGATSIADFADTDRGAVGKLDTIFWTDLPKMDIYAIIRDVNPIGGSEKAKSVETIVAKEGTDLKNVMYVGDSITDVDAFRLVKTAGGAAISFNGNDWAVKEASFAVTARNALPIGWLADLFMEEGLNGFEDLLMDTVTQENMESMSRISSRVRKEVRTEAIGSLG